MSVQKLLPDVAAKAVKKARHGKAERLMIRDELEQFLSHPGQVFRFDRLRLSWISKARYEFKGRGTRVPVVTGDYPVPVIGGVAVEVKGVWNHLSRTASSFSEKLLGLLRG